MVFPRETILYQLLLPSKPHAKILSGTQLTHCIFQGATINTCICLRVIYLDWITCTVPENNGLWMVHCGTSSGKWSPFRFYVLVWHLSSPHSHRTCRQGWCPNHHASSQQRLRFDCQLGLLEALGNCKEDLDLSKWRKQQARLLSTHTLRWHQKIIYPGDACSVLQPR